MMRVCQRVSARKSIRLKQYDYSRVGAYFVTICSDERKNCFGEIVYGRMKLSPIGEIAKSCWIKITEHFSNVLLDKYVIMPNHVHGMIIIHGRGADGAGTDNPELNDVVGAQYDVVGAQYIEPLHRKEQNRYQHIIPQSLGSIIRSYKSAVTRLCHRNFLTFFKWQRNYYERVIRNEQEMHALRLYITNNPLQWELDRENCNSRNFNIDFDVYFEDVFT